MGKHTQGPWKALKLHAKGNQGRWIVNSVTDYVCLCDAIPGLDFNEANARLIAAAPELLEALKTIIGGENRYEINYHDYMTAVSAIAKAEGGE